MHFRSMPNKKAVIWLNSADEIADKIRLGLKGNNETIEHAQQWFEIINQSSPKKASDRIWEAIELIAD
ncbi:hypothetical protein D3C87_1755040 [compost metagenome]